MFRLFKYLLQIIPLVFLTQCASNSAINDFFGIKMNQADIDYFRIVAYTESSGISYQSTSTMDPNVFAWANIEGGILRIKLINNSQSPILLNYDSDQYIIVSQDNNEIICLNGNLITYNNYSPILPNNSVELLLELPQNYWETIGMKNVQAANENYTADVWKGLNTIVVDKEKIKYIKIILNFSETIMLKPVP